MQAFGLSLIKGRLGSNQDRREIQTPARTKEPPGRESREVETPAEGQAFGAVKVSRTMKAAAAANDASCPRRGWPA